MTPKEKAIELIDKYRKWVNQIEGSYSELEYAKQCALIAVDEILKDKEIIDGMRVINDPYWLQVKEEIKKL